MKGPIIHTLLYRLSPEQQQQFHSEETLYNEIEALQSQTDSVFFCCAGECGSKLQVRTYAVGAFAEEASKPLTIFCKHCGNQTEFREIIIHQLKKTKGVIEVTCKPKRYDLQSRVNYILSQLRELSVEQSVTPDGHYTERVNELFDELKGVLDLLVSKQGRYLKKLRAEITRSIIQDRRKRYRAISAFRVKNLPDFSGCEDEAGLTEPAVNLTTSFSKIRKPCPTKQRHYLPHLIALLNLRITG